MKIRNIEEQDIKMIAGFEQEISRISFGDEAINDVEFHINKIIRAIPKEEKGMFVMEHDSNITGWLWICIKNNSLTNELYALIKSIYIVPGCRGEGYSTELIKSALRFCNEKQIKRITTKVHFDNFKARAMFEKVLFKNVHLSMEYLIP